MIRRVLMLMALSLAAPSAASAATITLDAGVLKFTATAGKTNNITLSQSAGNVTITRQPMAEDNDVFTLGGPCSATNDVATCAGPITRIEVDVRDGSDRVTAITTGPPPPAPPPPIVTIPMTVGAGDGNDAVDTGFGNDTIDGGVGDDDIDAGPGTTCCVAVKATTRSSPT